MQALCKPHGEEVRFAPKPVPWGWALQEPSRTQQAVLPRVLVLALHYK